VGNERVQALYAIGHSTGGDSINLLDFTKQSSVFEVAVMGTCVCFSEFCFFGQSLL
jgi:hypothetical protein